MKNIGNTDRIIRIVLGIILILFFGFWFKLLGVILLITSITKYCLIYQILGINTNKSEPIVEKKVVKKKK